MKNNNAVTEIFWRKKIQDKSLIKQPEAKTEVFSFFAGSNDLQYFYRATNNSVLPQFSILSAIYAFLLDKYLENYNGVITSYNSLVADKGNGNPFFLEFSLEDRSFKQYLASVAGEVQTTLTHIDYDRSLFNGDEYSYYGLGVNSSNLSKCLGVYFDFGITKEGIAFHIRYKVGFIHEAVVRSIASSFKLMLTNFDTLVNQNLNDVPLLLEEDKLTLLRGFNNTAIDYPTNASMVSMFEDQVVRTPRHTALYFQNRATTYQELNERANALAHALRSQHGVETEQVVAVLLQKSEEAVVSFLAVLKAGGVYLPIDPNYPEDRIQYILQDSGAKCVIAEQATADKLACDNGVIFIDTISFADFPSTNPDQAVKPRQLAYLIYTSGSTGRPKGVLIEHTSNVNMSLDQVRKFEITASDKVVWFSSLSFDASISEMMMAFYSGATLIIPEERDVKETNQLVSFLAETGASVVTFPPSYLNLISRSDLRTLRCVITAGEPANPLKAVEIAHAGISYYNAYGPTEYAVCATIFKVSPEDIVYGRVPIGGPIANTRIYILDDMLRLVPIGMPGTLYVSGPGLARGYLNQDKLTQEKFVPNPFAEGTRMYNTGDLGRWIDDGKIEFLGRRDSQVKLRGFRIELGEIESQVYSAAPEVDQVAVDVKVVNHERALVCYYVSNKSLNHASLRNQLLLRLPEYMVPAFYVAIDRIPTTPNGKTDRHALPDVGGEGRIQHAYAAPQTDLERKLVVIWEEILGVRQIGIHDNFFELGGHSLLMMQVINRIFKETSYRISFEDFFEASTIQAICGKLELRQYVPIARAPVSSSYPVSPAQHRFWILSQLEDASRAYNMPGAVRIDGPLDDQRFELAFQQIIRRHEIFRTYFQAEDASGELRQLITPEHDTVFRIERIRIAESDDQDAEAIAHIRKVSDRSFDLSRSPLVRATLFTLAPERYIFFLSLHHIISDGWSIELLINEVLDAYHSPRAEATVPAIQYKDYVWWLQDALKSDAFVDMEQYWISKFTDDIPILDLPASYPRPVIQTFHGASLACVFSAQLSKQLKEYAVRKEATLFMVLMAGVNALLSRYANQDDIIVGTPIAGRNHPDLENQMGLFLNTLAIRTKIGNTDRFSDLVGQIKENLVDAYRYQQYPFDSLIAKLNLKRDLSRSALFDVLVVLQNQRNIFGAPERGSDLQISAFDLPRITSQFDISFIFQEDEDLTLTIEYNTAIYNTEFIGQLGKHLVHYLQQAVLDDQQYVAQVDYLDDVDKKLLLSDFNNTLAPRPDKTIVDLIEEQVDRSKDKVAFVFKDHRITYDALNKEANRFARHLLKLQGGSPPQPVAIVLGRSRYLLTALLGILKSRNSYVMIDPALPEKRLAYMMHDAGCKLIVNDACIAHFEQTKEGYSDENLPQKPLPGDEVYVMYTSGSTGNPKGAINLYRGFTNTVMWYAEALQISADDRVGVISNISFDLTQKNYFAPLLVGATVYLDREYEPHSAANFILENAITIVNCAPVLFYGLLDAGVSNINSVRAAILGGESIDLVRINRAKNDLPSLRVYNSYGPSEASDVSAFYELTGNEKGIIPIGNPLPNTTIFILNEHNALAPIGVNGEICIGGIGVGVGYLNNERLNREKFIETSLFGRLYKTGDIGRWLPDGKIEFLGRRDNQVKVHGHRIELGEIENNISLFSSDIASVVVEAKTFKSEKTLLAYYVASARIDISALRAHLLHHVPAYMVPAHFLSIEAMPLTPNGKIDRKALPDIEATLPTADTYVAPRNETEKTMAELWQDVLEVTRVGATDNFFELGGNSMKFYRLSHLVRKRLGLELSVTDMYRYGSIDGLLRHAGVATTKSLTATTERDAIPLSQAQLRLWLNSQLQSSRDVITIPLLQRDRTLTLSRVREIIGQLVRRHEIFRTTFHFDERLTATQRVHDATDFLIDQIVVHVDSLDQLSIDEILKVETLPLLKVFILENSAERKLFLYFNHIIFDGLSIEILAREFDLLSKNIALPPLLNQYKDFARWEAEQMATGGFTRELQYWQSIYSTPPEYFSAARRDLKRRLPFKRQQHLGQISGEDMVKIISLCKTHGITEFSFFNTALRLSVETLTGQRDVIIGHYTETRTIAGTADLIGLFLNIIPIRFVRTKGDTFETALAYTQQTIAQAHEHKNIPFNYLVRNIDGIRPVPGVFPLIDLFISFNEEMNIVSNGFTLLPTAGDDTVQNGFSFRLSISKSGTGYSLLWKYNGELYASDFIQQWSEIFNTIITDGIIRKE